MTKNIKAIAKEFNAGIDSITNRTTKFFLDTVNSLKFQKELEANNYNIIEDYKLNRTTSIVLVEDYK